MIDWPESQEYMDYEGYKENTIAHPTESGAIFADEDWVKAVDNGEVELKDDEEEDLA